MLKFAYSKPVKISSTMNNETLEKPILKIYQAVSGLHNADAVKAAHTDIFSALEKNFKLETLPLSGLASQGGTVFLFVATGGVEEGVKAALSYSDITFIYLIADGLQNSLAASMEISAWLKSRGIGSRIIHGTPEAMVAEIEHAGARNALRGCRVGLLGEPSGWLISSDIDFDKVSKHYGIEFVFVSLEDVVSAYGNSEPAVVDGIMDLERVEPDSQDIEKALRLTSAIEKVVADKKLDAFTLKCFDLLDSLHTTGCLALAVLNAKGIPAGCEGDVPSLLTMLLARKVAGADAFMANPSRIDTRKNEIILAHCTLPLRMARRNILRSHFESGIGVAIQGVFTEGVPVTVVKWWGKDMNEHFVSSGELIENLNNPSMCRTQVRLHLDADVNYFLDRPLGNHHVILLGDHTEALNRFFNA